MFLIAFDLKIELTPFNFTVNGHKLVIAPMHRDVPRGVYDEAIPSKSSISLKIAIHFNFLSIIDSFIEMRIYNPLILSYSSQGIAAPDASGSQ